MITNILVPVDGSDCSDRAVTHAIEIAKVFHAKLNFLYVANINQLAINASLTTAIIEASRKAGDVILARAEEMTPPETEHKIFLETGSPAAVILSLEEKLKVDLIIMGSRGLGIVKGVLLGSVSQYITERAKCPVMVVK